MNARPNPSWAAAPKPPAHAQPPGVPYTYRGIGFTDLNTRPRSRPPCRSPSGRCGTRCPLLETYGL